VALTLNEALHRLILFTNDKFVPFPVESFRYKEVY
jgi:hypothetical protein